MLTKVKLRQKPLADGKLSLYLDFYPPIADPVTGKKTRREFLQLHIWEKPKGSLQRQHNADTLFVAEQIRFERENALLKSNIYSDLEKEHIAYLERSEKKFIEYYEESFKDKPLANWYRYSGAFYLLKKFCPNHPQMVRKLQELRLESRQSLPFILRLPPHPTPILPRSSGTSPLCHSERAQRVELSTKSLELQRKKSIPSCPTRSGIPRRHPSEPHPTTISHQPPHIIFENHDPILSHRPHHC